MISPFLDWNKYELFNGYGLGKVFIHMGEFLKCTGTAVLEH